jgi:hypothetical protein
MAVSLLVVLSTILLGYGVSRQFLGAQSAWESLSLAPLLACLVIIGGANSWGPVRGRWPIIVLAGGAGLMLLLAKPAAPPGDEPSDSAPPLSRRWSVLLAVLLLAILGYVAYAQAFTLDTDNWIHEPLIAGYTLGIFPPVHPFFPEVEMHGHYGRDLLIGTLLPRGADPLTVVWWLNPVLALASSGVLLAIFRRWGDSPSSLLAALALPFFGICVGFRVGLADSFDGNNGMVYALAIGLFYAMLRVFELLPTNQPGHPLGLWCVAGYLLGVYQLVYETHFGLFLLTGACLLAPALWRSPNRPRLLGGVAITVTVALLLACSEGGPMTDLFRSTSSAQSSQAQANKGQHVSMTFPKTQLFRVQATSAEYQRLSPGFRLAPFRQSAPSTADEGYLSIFSPAFLVTHWLPLFCAPVTLLWLLRRRHWPGLAFWIFGAWAYLVPGLVDFGPIYEWEYFRWEFAAGFAFSVPLGLFCGSLLDTAGAGGTAKAEGAGYQITVGRRAPLVVLGWALLILALWPGEKMINRAIIEVQKQGWPTQNPPQDWRVARQELGVTGADIRCAQHLAQQILPGEVVLTNLGSESPLGLWPDCVVSALSGARVAGRAHPPEGRRLHAHPNYHRSALQKALMASARPDLLWNSGVSWLLLDPDQGSLDEALAKSPHALLERREKEPNGARRELWKLSPPPSLAIDRVPTQPPFRSLTRLMTDQGATPLTRLDDVEWRCGQPYRLQIAALNARPETARLGWLRIEVRDAEDRLAEQPISYLLGANPLPGGTGDLHEVVFVTPLSEGSFTVVGQLLGGPQGNVDLFRFPINLSLQDRLEGLKAQLEVPGNVAAKTFVPLKLSVFSQRPLRTQNELDLLTRIREVNGDYVWELDRLATPLNLNLPQAGTQVVEWNITAPWRAGAYELEMEILDKATGARVPLTLPSSQLGVSAP